MWLKIGVLGFGGPAGQIALLHRELVDERRWIDEARFAHALSYCMLLPGPEAQQLATYLGWLMHGVRGGLVAGLLFVLPGLAVILALSAVYVAFHQQPAVAAVLFGLKAAVVAIVLDAVVRLARRALRSRWLVAIAVGSFVALALLAVPFPIVLIAAATIGLLARASLVPSPTPTADAVSSARPTLVDRLAAEGRLAHTVPSLARAVRTALVAGAAWAAPIALAALVLGAGSVLVDLGWFFAHTAAVTFGGAYAVLAYVAQRADGFGWLTPGQMVDGLGLAETTPGPLVLVLPFVGFLGAHGAPGALPPMLAGVLGALMTAWVTFAPSFLWIFVGAPWIEAVRRQRALAAALAAISAAVVGVIASLALWSTLHVLFATVEQRSFGPLRVLVVEPGSLDVAALVLAAGAAAALIGRRVGLLRVLAITTALGAAWAILAR